MKNRQGRLFMLAEASNNRTLDKLSGLRPSWPVCVEETQGARKLSNPNAVRVGKNVIRVRQARG